MTDALLAIKKIGDILICKYTWKKPKHKTLATKRGAIMSMVINVIIRICSLLICVTSKYLICVHLLMTTAIENV